MKFCDKCGSYMKLTEKGFECRKCGNVIHAEAQTEILRKIERSSSICVVDSSEGKYLKVSETCPKCGNNEAFRWFAYISGEHAGIRRERTVEHLKCTKCDHSWTRTT